MTLCSRFGLCRRSRLAIDAYTHTHTQYWSIYLPTYVRACIYVYVANTNPKPVCQALANDRHDDEVVDRCLLGFVFGVLDIVSTCSFLHETFYGSNIGKIFYF